MIDIDATHFDLSHLVAEVDTDVPIVRIQQADETIEISPEMWSQLKSYVDSALTRRETE